MTSNPTYIQTTIRVGLDAFVVLLSFFEECQPTPWIMSEKGTLGF